MIVLISSDCLQPFSTFFRFLFCPLLFLVCLVVGCWSHCDDNSIQTFYRAQCGDSTTKWNERISSIFVFNWKRHRDSQRHKHTHTPLHRDAATQTGNETTIKSTFVSYKCTYEYGHIYQNAEDVGLIRDEQHDVHYFTIFEAEEGGRQHRANSTSQL